MRFGRRARTATPAGPQTAGPQTATVDHDRLAFATGTVLALDDVPDPTFAERMLGDGIAIRPTAPPVVAPVGGTVTLIAPTKHAIAVRTDLGEDILLHIGLETVELDGEGIQCHVQIGQRVDPGQLLATVDWPRIQDRIADTAIIMVVTNSREFHLEWLTDGRVEAGRTRLFRSSTRSV